MSLWRRIRRYVAVTIMGWVAGVLSCLVPNEEVFYEGMENELYDDTYTKLRKRDREYRQRWMEHRRPLLWKALGAERTEQMLSRIERRIEWEQTVYRPAPQESENGQEDGVAR
jgi:hypothetical protein